MSTVRRVVAEEAERAGIPMELVLLVDDRRLLVVWVRQRSCRRLRAMGYSYPAIGRAIGRDHSTVINAASATPSDVPPQLSARRYEPRTPIPDCGRLVFTLPPSAFASIPLSRLMGQRA